MSSPLAATTLRQVKPIPLDKVEKRLPAGPRPRLEWVKPTSLFVDQTYQRGLSKESYKLIEKVAANFAWARMKPPIVVEIAGGGLHVIDGQHTAIAAASIGLEEIPVIVVVAPTLQGRAASFVGHNTDRLRVDPITVFRALLAAEDPDAMDVANVCKRAGVRIRNFNKSSVIAEGDTMAIGTIRTLIKRIGVRKARVVLEALKNGQRGPISSHEITAADKCLHVLRPDSNLEQLGAVILAGDEKMVLDARLRATRERRPVRDVLAELYAAALDKLKERK
jgi:hypothetical protein